MRLYERFANEKEKRQVSNFDIYELRALKQLQNGIQLNQKSFAARCFYEVYVCIKASAYANFVNALCAQSWERVK